MPNIARITNDGKIQTVDEHLRNVREHCGFNADKIGLEACGKLSGVLHDIGKFNKAFAEYIYSVHDDPDINKKGPDHATAGAVYIQELAGNDKDQLKQLTAQIVSMTVMWHHGGLKDIRDYKGDSPYLIRLEKFKDQKWIQIYRQIVEEFHEHFSRSSIEELFDKAVVEIVGLVKKINLMTKDKSERIFCFGLVCKFLYSCLIDADRYDAALFEDGKKFEPHKEHADIWQNTAEVFERKLCNFDSNGKDINSLRTMLADNCLKSACMKPGIYTLNCPTGSGKTLSSLRYALHHAAGYKKDRIFYIIPLISIIEQNSKVIRDFLGDDNLVLELHSAVEIDDAAYCDVFNNNENNSAKEYELVTERMDSPIVITTMVRFLNTFFKSKARSPRAIHNFANSVIIFDEIQTIPVKCIGMFNSLINFLVYVCNATVVLSTATQIVLDRQHGKERPLINVSQYEISHCTKKMRDKFVRVDFDTSMVYGQPNSLEMITEKIKSATMTNRSILCIFNTKKSTEIVYDAISAMQSSGNLDSDIIIYFLTTALCPKHRFEKIDKIKNDLRTGKRIIVISTQLIEAGVDVSFDTVFRSLAGLDSIIQSAGRCNREGTCSNRGQVMLINPEFEDLRHLESISKGKTATLKLLREFEKHPEKFDSRYDSQESIEYYFDTYLEDVGDVLKYPFKPDRKAGAEYMYDTLSSNGYGGSNIKTILNQAFETAGENFEPIDTAGIPVTVPYKDGRQLIDTVLSVDKFSEKKVILRKLQKYMINIMGFNENEINDYVVFYENLGIYVLREGYYDDTKGFVKEGHLETLTI